MVNISLDLYGCGINPLLDVSFGICVVVQSPRVILYYIEPVVALNLSDVLLLLHVNRKTRTTESSETKTVERCTTTRCYSGMPTTTISMRSHYQRCADRVAVFEDSGHEDLHYIHPLSNESGGLSDESERTDKAASTMNGSRPRSKDKLTSGTKIKKEKIAKIFATNLSEYVQRAASASEALAAKIDSFVGPAVSTANTLMAELLLTGLLEKKNLSVLLDVIVPVTEVK